MFPAQPFRDARTVKLKSIRKQSVTLDRSACGVPPLATPPHVPHPACGRVPARAVGLMSDLTVRSTQMRSGASTGGPSICALSSFYDRFPFWHSAVRKFDGEQEPACLLTVAMEDVSLSAQEMGMAVLPVARHIDAQKTKWRCCWRLSPHGLP
jgi:hypothetical protein